jgi:hypothetical protein
MKKTSIEVIKAASEGSERLAKLGRETDTVRLTKSGFVLKGDGFDMAVSFHHEEDEMGQTAYVKWEEGDTVKTFERYAGDRASALVFAIDENL